MKNKPEASIIKLSAKFDKQLLDILSADLNALKSAENVKITALLPKQIQRLRVA